MSVSGGAEQPVDAREEPAEEQSLPSRAADLGRWFSTAAPGTDAPRIDAPLIDAPRADASSTDPPRRDAPRATAPRHAVAEGTGSRSTTARGLPQQPAWGPVPGGDYGTQSPPEVHASALEILMSGPVAVLTGAGMSTASGLPDYRGRDSVPRTPMTYQEFMRSDLARRRYWARSTVGWTQFNRAAPNRGHRLLAALGESLDILGVITQNVDGLHQRAGSTPVVDLHGRLDRVRCQHCDTLSSRQALHERMLAMNPQLEQRLPQLAADAAQAPDGDAEVDRTSDFRYPPCPLCGGILKPDVVFFGESARDEVVERAFALQARASVLLVLGSSLSVQSGLRFVRRAQRDGTPVVILNDGPTRAEQLATVRVHGRIEDVLAQWTVQLGRDTPNLEVGR